MPPKRTRPSQPSAPSDPQPRRSKLAKEHNLSASEESEISEAFTIFSQPISDPKGKRPASSSATTSVLPVPAIRKALIALGLSPSATELREFTSILDPEGEGYTTYENFVAVAALKLRSKDGQEDEEEREREVEEGYKLFTNGGEGPITLAHLKRVARVLGEDVEEGVLRDMVLEANGGEGVARGVGREGFRGVMGRAGVFR